MSGRDGGGDLGHMPGERPQTARDRIFGVDPAVIDDLFVQAGTLDLHASSAELVHSFFAQWRQRRELSPKQLRTLEDIVRRGR